MAKSKQKRDWTLNISAKSLGELKKVTKLSRGHGVPRQTMYSWVSKCEKTDSSAFLGAWVCSWVRNKSFDGQSIFVSKEISRMSAKIKILFLVHSFSIGGVQKVNVSMINGIDKNEFAAHVLYVQDGPLRAELDEDFIQICKIGEHLRLKSLSNICYIRKICRYVKENQIDVIHSMDPVFYIIGSTASRLCNIVHIRTQPNLIRTFEKLNAKTFQYTPFARWTDAFITLNNVTREDLIAVGVSPEKVTRIYTYRNLDRLDSGSKAEQNIREEFGVLETNKIVLTVHRLVENKGLETFIAMIPYVVSEYPNVVFLVVGDGPLRKELEDMTKALEVEQNVIFTGFRTDVEDIIKQVTFGVYPLALSAGMGSVITSGKVLISRKGSAMDEYIEDEHTGILVDSDDPRDYAHATVKLLKNNLLLESMESNIREMLPSKFDGQKNMEIFENLVRDVVFINNSKKRWLGK